MDEPNFSVAYAKMCNELRAKEVESASFRKILITRCQQEFEKNKDAESNNKEKKIKEIESQPDMVCPIATFFTPVLLLKVLLNVSLLSLQEKRKELQLMYEEEERKIRMKSVGNIR